MTAVSDEAGREPFQSPQHIIEGIILRRLHDKRIEGYTLEMSKEIEAALSASPVAQEPAWRYEIQHGPDGETDWAWVYDAENNLVCTAKTYHAAAIVRASSPPATPAGTPANRGDRVIYWLKRYQADEHLDDDACEELDALINVLSKGVKVQPSAGVGADEIARVFARWKNSKNLHESLAAQNIEKELLALLSRAGDQSNSTQKDGSR